MLPDGDCHSKVVVWEFWTEVLVCQDYVYANDGVLRILSSLQEHVDIHMLNSLKFTL